MYWALLQQDHCSKHLDLTYILKLSCMFDGILQFGGASSDYTAYSQLVVNPYYATVPPSVLLSVYILLVRPDIDFSPSDGVHCTSCIMVHNNMSCLVLVQENDKG